MLTPSALCAADRMLPDETRSLIEQNLGVGLPRGRDHKVTSGPCNGLGDPAIANRARFIRRKYRRTSSFLVAQRPNGQEEGGEHTTQLRQPVKDARRRTRTTRDRPCLQGGRASHNARASINGSSTDVRDRLESTGGSCEREGERPGRTHRTAGAMDDEGAVARSCEIEAVHDIRSERVSSPVSRVMTWG